MAQKGDKKLEILIDFLENSTFFDSFLLKTIYLNPAIIFSIYFFLLVRRFSKLSSCFLFLRKFIRGNCEIIEYKMMVGDFATHFALILLAWFHYSRSQSTFCFCRRVLLLWSLNLLHASKTWKTRVLESFIINYFSRCSILCLRKATC